MIRFELKIILRILDYCSVNSEQWMVATYYSRFNLQQVASYN